MQEGRDDGQPGGRAPDARREEIRAQVAEQGYVRIDELAEAHGVSAMTIHRDLDELQGRGWLRKVRGGATAQPSSLYHGDIRHRMQAMAEEKAALARAAVDLVEPGSTLMLDESTTALAVAELLPARGPLTVITHFLALLNRLTGEPSIDLVALGGGYYPAYDAFLGVRTVDAVAGLHADLLLMSTTAVTRGHCYHQSQETVTVKRALMAAVDRTVLLVDHTKFTKRGLYRLAPLSAFDSVVVDRATPREVVEGLRSDGVRVVVAPDV